MKKLFDTHAHLDMKHFDKDREEIIKRAKERKIGIITVGIDIKSSQRAIKLAEKHDLFCAVGIHPHEAKNFLDLDQTMAKLGKLALSSGKVVAIGEIGLDYYRNYSPRKDQKKLFEAQLLLAKNLDLPVIVHNRESASVMLGILGEFNHTGVVHSFFSDIKLAKRFLKLDFYLGISGPITFPNAKHREVLKQLPLQHILVETDCPYLTPVPHRGKRNEPAYVKYIAQEVANLKEVKAGEVNRQTTDNAINLFDLS